MLKEINTNLEQATYLLVKILPIMLMEFVDNPEYIGVKADYNKLSHPFVITEYRAFTENLVTLEPKLFAFE